MSFTMLQMNLDEHNCKLLKSIGYLFNYLKSLCRRRRRCSVDVYKQPCAKKKSFCDCWEVSALVLHVAGQICVKNTDEQILCLIFGKYSPSLLCQISGLAVGHKKMPKQKTLNYKQTASRNRKASGTKNLVTYPKYSKYSYIESVKRDKKLADSA